MFHAVLSSGRILIVAVLVVGSMDVGRAEDERSSGPVHTNLEVMQELVGKITEEIIARSHIASGDSIDVKFSPVEDGWIGQSALVSVLKSAGCEVFDQGKSATGGRILFEVMEMDFRVHYGDFFQGGMFGAKRVQRTISAGLSYQTVNTQTNEILSTGSLHREAIDTVAMDDIEALEHPSARSTHGVIPSEGFLDRFVEPLVIIGATGIAVYLFFHVRS